MKFKKFILFLAGTFLWYSCQPPEGSEITYTIEGNIYLDCSLAPYANKDIVLFQEFGVSTGGDLAYATTDETGHFQLTYAPDNDYSIKIEAEDGDHIIYVPLKEDLSNLLAYFNPTCNIQMSLNVINIYSNLDTLFITNYNDLSEKLLVPGPFNSGLLYLAEDFNMIGLNYNGSPSDLGYKINDGEWQIKKIYLFGCETTDVTVDIY